MGAEERLRPRRARGSEGGARRTGETSRPSALGALLLGVAAWVGAVACSARPLHPVAPVPPDLAPWVGEGVGLDRLVTLTRDLGATSAFFGDELGFAVSPGQVFHDGFAVHYVTFRDRPLFEIQSIYDRERALAEWGPTEVRFLDAQEGGFQIGIGVSDIPRARRQLAALGVPERGALGSPAQTSFDGTQAPMANKSAVLLPEELPGPHAHLTPVYFTNYTHVARGSGRERPPAARHPALRERHPNGATRIDAVYLAVDDLEEALAAYGDLGFTGFALGEHEAWGARMATLDAHSAELVLLAPARPGGPVADFLRERGQRVAPLGMRVAVRDLDLAQSIVEHNLECSLRRYRVAGVPCFLVPLERTAGVFVEFTQEQRF